LLKGSLVVIYIIVALGLIASVVLQSGKSAGLSGAIAGGAESFFGKKKGLDELLVKLTTILAVVFFLTSLVLFKVW